MAVILRPAAQADVRKLFDWVNSSDSLMGKRHTAGPIAWADHLGWFGRLLADPMARLWIVESDGMEIGQVRLSGHADGRRLVDIYIAPDHRGAGRAAAALSQALSEAQRLWPGSVVVAEVLAANTPSHRLFQRLGFELVYNDAQMQSYEYKLAGAS